MVSDMKMRGEKYRISIQYLVRLGFHLHLSFCIGRTEKAKHMKREGIMLPSKSQYKNCSFI